MPKLINLTPHPINLPTGTIMPSGEVARVVTTEKTVGDINGIPLITQKFGVLSNLPDPEPDTFFIVSTIVRTACPHRQDLLSPAGPIRDEDGNVLGCKSLTMNSDSDSECCWYCGCKVNP